MKNYELADKLIENLGYERLAEEMFRALDTDELNELLEYIDRMCC